MLFRRIFVYEKILSVKFSTDWKIKKFSSGWKIRGEDFFI